MVKGQGFIGQGLYNSSKNVKIYKTWSGMLERCYCTIYQQQKPTYIGCTVDSRWYNFQIFAVWFDENYKEGFHLDKDILLKGNKIYSPETCSFVPHEINIVFTKRDSLRGDLPIGVRVNKHKKYVARVGLNGKNTQIGTFDTIEEAFTTYKQAKEEYIKEVAEEWKDRIEPRVYKAMLNYKVEITD